VSDKEILLVEDNDDDAELTFRAFRDARVANPMVRARDGVEALDFLFARGKFAERAGAPLPTLVLLDLNLPRVGGLEVLRQIRAGEATKLLPVVVLSSSDEERDRLAAYANHVNSYVRKPVSYAEFVATSRTLGLYWTITNVAPPRAR
jgi:two-component system response regulator